ncbi:MAG: TfoX/Sxy family protein [Tannerella sp.]|jgi:hypothetical protein|nr:TfoX/Sxy family protein [Tannerella sp.]
MAYNTQLADMVREYLLRFYQLEIEEKKMFQGLAFIVNGKMCVNVSGQNLMCRFDPVLTESLSEKTGFLPVIMKKRQYKGYCYVEPVGFKSRQDFEFWINLCIDFNGRAGSSKR